MYVGWLVAVAMSLPAFAPRVSAQSSPALSLQLNAGSPQLGVTGDAGSPLTIQYATNLAAGAWQALTNFTLLNPALITDATGPATNARYYRAVIAVPADMNWIPAGSFIIGSPTNEVGRSTNETRHTVTLTRGFFMGKYPVTQANYSSLMNTNPAYFNTNNGFVRDLNRPVEQVDWSDATNYCGKLTQQERAAGHIFATWSYRLPTEAEWEYACRAGTTTPFYYGNDLLSGLANFNGQYEYVGGVGTVFNSGGVVLNRTVAVGGYAPNARGLYDMAGNVWEWCQDWFGNFSTNSVTDPPGPGAGTMRVFRGGALNVIGRDCRSASRSGYFPSENLNTVGFRVVLAGP